MWCVHAATPENGTGNAPAAGEFNAKRRIVIAWYTIKGANDDRGPARHQIRLGRLGKFSMDLDNKLIVFSCEGLALNLADARAGWVTSWLMTIGLRDTSDVGDRAHYSDGPG